MRFQLSYNQLFTDPYSFQGQEHDDEVKGDANSMNFEYRMSDTRLGRFFAIDPLATKYPYYTPYQFSGNRLIDMIELEGLEPAEAGKKEGEYQIAAKKGDSDKFFGWTWSKAEGSKELTWVQGDITTFDSNKGQAITNPDGDAAYADHPKKNISTTTAGQLGTSTQSLFSSVVVALTTGTIGADSKVGARLAIHFGGGKGKNLYWSSSSVLAKEIEASGEFKKYSQAFEKAAMDFYKANKTLDGFKIKAESSLENEPNLNGSSLFLTTTVGGIQGVKAKITKISATDITVKYTVMDTFGAGTSDQTGKKQFLPGLVSMYVLQHFKSNGKSFRPFTNIINIEH